MGRKADPSRAHFDEVSEQTAGHGGAVKTRKFFECVHCGWKMQRSSFAADVGRAHLSANKYLAQDVCTGADDDAASRHAKFEQEIKDASVGARRRPRRLLLLLMPRSSSMRLRTGSRMRSTDKGAAHGSCCRMSKRTSPRCSSCRRSTRAVLFGQRPGRRDWLARRSACRRRGVGTSQDNGDCLDESQGLGRRDQGRH